MADMSMKFKLFGQDVSATKALDKVGKEAGKTGGAFKQFGATAGGVLGGLGMASVITQVVKFGKESVAAFGSAASEVKTLKRYLGGTAEDASKLRAAAAMTGVSTEDLARGLGKMSKFAFTGAIQLQHFNAKAAEAAAKHKPMTAQLGKAAQAFKNIGVDTMDASGKMRSTNDILMDLADGFKAMPDGVEKTAMVMQVFGKNGMAMLPFLNKGAAGLKEFGIEAEKMGTVLSEKDMEATKENTIAKRRLSEAVKGLQISVGRNLYPSFTKLTILMSERVVPAVSSVLGFFERNKKVIGPLAAVVGTLTGSMWAFVKVTKVITAVTQAWSVVTGLMTSQQTGLNIAMRLNPVGLIITGIVLLGAALVVAYKKSETFRKIVQGAMRGVAGAFKWLKDAAVAVFNWLKPAFGVVGKLIAGYVNTWIGGINLIFRLLNKIPHIKAFGHDIGFNLPQIPLLGQPSAGIDTVSQRGRRDLMRSSGMAVTVNVAGSVVAERDLARSVRDEMAQMLRRRGLSPAALGV